jgi:endonuclease YncB( thermonuclease family)
VLLVADGDTIDVEVTLSNGQKIPLALRIEGMNAPETDKERADCDAEIAAGKEAKAYAGALLGESATVYLRGVKDFYARQLACITLDDGRDYAQTMIAAGHAVKGSRSGNWCQ